MIVAQAYTIVMALCSGEPVEYEEYTSHLAKFDPAKVEFQMHEDYEMIVSKTPKQGIADTVWIDPSEKTIILKGDLDWKLEVRVYTDMDLFNTHVQKIKEIEGLT